MLNKKHFRAHDIGDCVLDILISQHGDDCRVKPRCHFDCVPGGCGAGYRVEEEDGTGEDADGGQAGGAGEKGFAATTG